MNKNKIEIAIVMQSGERAELQLSPRNYKQNFRDFLKKYNIGTEQALNLKRVIQLSLVELSKMRFQSFEKDERKKIVQREQLKQKSRELEMQHHIESPRFKKPQDNHQVEQKLPHNMTYEMDKAEKKPKMKQELSDQEENIEDIPIISMKNIKSIQKEEIVQQSKKQQYPVGPQERLSEQQQLPQNCEEDQQLPQNCQEEDQQPFPEILPSKLKLPIKGLSQHLQKPKVDDHQSYFHIQHPEGKNTLIHSPLQQPKTVQKPTKYQQCLSKGLKTNEKSLNSHKKRQNCKENQKKPKQKKMDQYSEAKTKKHQKCLSQDRSTYDRLYYQHTDSFRSKKNQEINRKQILDEIQVQRYDLNNRLKRTTKQFFYELHKRTTESWQFRTSKSKQKTQQQISKQYCPSPTKKIPISKAFKGSLWQSRSRCEAHIYQEKIQKQQSKFKQKQKQIRKRIRQNKSKSVQKKENQHQSRSCQKCSPQKKQLPKRKKIIIPKTQQRHKKNYISQVLKEAYQQRLRQLKALNFF